MLVYFCNTYHTFDIAENYMNLNDTTLRAIKYALEFRIAHFKIEQQHYDLGSICWDNVQYNTVRVEQALDSINEMLKAQELNELNFKDCYAK
jgi:hypothetical protein